MWQSGCGCTDARSTMLAARALASAPLLVDDRRFLNIEDLMAKVVWNNIQSHQRNGLTVLLAPELLDIAFGSSPNAAALRELGSICGGAVLCERPHGRAVDERDRHRLRLTDREGLSWQLARDVDAILSL